jgi:hypothetical protein
VCLPYTLSLAPAPGDFQPLVCGIDGDIGDGLGVLGAKVWQECAGRPARLARGSEILAPISMV